MALKAVFVASILFLLEKMVAEGFENKTAIILELTYCEIIQDILL